MEEYGLLALIPIGFIGLLWVYKGVSSLMSRELMPFEKDLINKIKECKVEVVYDRRYNNDTAYKYTWGKNVLKESPNRNFMLNEVIIDNDLTWKGQSHVKQAMLERNRKYISELTRE